MKLDPRKVGVRDVQTLWYLAMKLGGQVRKVKAGLN